MISNIYSNNGYDFFEQKFKNRQDLISYLKNAKTSLAFSSGELASHKTSDIYLDWTKTKSFDEALQLFENGWYEDFDNFLVQKKQIDKYFPYIAKKKTYRNYICGSVPNVVNAINNLPLSMRKVYDDNNSQNIITVNYNFGYPMPTTQKQVFINGLLTLSLIDFFDSLGYRVDLRFYEISKIGNQIVFIDIILKSPGERINLQKLYFAFCNPSFLRRIIFRVKETMQGLDRQWRFSYGHCMPTDEIKKILSIDENNIFINWPDQMGVKGENIEEDIKSFLDAIVLGNYIEIDEERFNICDDKHVLKKKK